MTSVVAIMTSDNDILRSAEVVDFVNNDNDNDNVDAIAETETETEAEDDEENEFRIPSLDEIKAKMGLSNDSDDDDDDDDNNNNNNIKNVDDPTTIKSVTPTTPKIFDLNSFQKYATQINGTLGGKDWSSDDDNDNDNDNDDNKSSTSSSAKGPKIFDLSSFQKYATQINGTLGGKEWDSDDDDSKSSKSSKKSPSPEDNNENDDDDDDSLDLGEEGKDKFLAFHSLQRSPMQQHNGSFSSGGGGGRFLRRGSSSGRPIRRMSRQNSIKLQSLLKGNSNKSNLEDSISDIAASLAVKQELSQRGVRFADEVDEREISRLRQSCINILFYAEEEFADFKYEAFMEECGLDPNEYD